MKQSKDPFEVAFEDQDDESPPDSPTLAPNEIETQSKSQHQAQSESASAQINVDGNTQEDYDDDDVAENISARPTNPKPLKAKDTGKAKEEEDDEEEEDNMEVELGKFAANGDPDKMAKMQSILSQFTEEQMSRYESFRRSGFQKANMKRLLASLTGSAKISIPMTIVVSGIAKMFVGDLVEAARVVMTERRESGPIRPCHIREAYRRLKLEGKVPKRSVPRLFR
ncbi:Transcription initiation factor TFIID subunit like [Actinidia chinensis var. chinensis]|uniref:Transcription initiation factor TFIID subunit like n=1 Tax=Actinidia chinensis var. chinensis TaxID=1590841 RepID=A0A2R6QAW6_ACTCC|nr:Transcription initiation factor TFIID subunit like [Actinidia chinensis var. chinensis]